MVYSNFIGWTCGCEERALVICKSEACSTGPHVTLSLTIYEDLSWSVSYRNQKVKQEFCKLLKDLPFTINTGILHC